MFNTKAPEGFSLDECIADTLRTYCVSFLERTDSPTGTLCNTKNVPIRVICVAKALSILSLIPSERVNVQCWRLFNAILKDPFNFRSSEALAHSTWNKTIMEFLQ